MRATLALVLLGAAAIGATADDRASSGVPPELKRLISQIGDAAKKKDFVALRSAMTQEFIWSFGGDGNADQAIAEWKKYPKYLSDLAAATKAKCGAEGAEYFQCPVNAGARFRAGFRLVGGQWKMAYFVAGD